MTSVVGGPVIDYGVAAGADLNTGPGTGAQYKALVVGGTIAANNGALGILQNRPKSGEAATVRVFGPSKCVAGGAITAGARFRITTSGYAVACGSNEVGIGRCGVTAAVSGGTFEGIVNFLHGLTSVVSAHLT